MSVDRSVGQSVGPLCFSNMEKRQKMNKRLKGEGRLGEGERERRGGGGGRGGEGEGDEEGRGGDGRKRSQRTHPLFVYKLVFRRKKYQFINNLTLLYKKAHGIENKTCSLKFSPSRKFSANFVSNATFRNLLASS